MAKGIKLPKTKAPKRTSTSSTIGRTTAGKKTSSSTIGKASTNTGDRRQNISNALKNKDSTIKQNNKNTSANIGIANQKTNNAKEQLNNSVNSGINTIKNDAAATNNKTNQQANVAAANANKITSSNSSDASFFKQNAPGQAVTSRPSVGPAPPPNLPNKPSSSSSTLGGYSSSQSTISGVSSIKGNQSTMSGASSSKYSSSSGGSTSKNQNTTRFDNEDDFDMPATTGNKGQTYKDKKKEIVEQGKLDRLQAEQNRKLREENNAFDRKEEYKDKQAAEGKYEVNDRVQAAKDDLKVDYITKAKASLWPHQKDKLKRQQKYDDKRATNLVNNGIDPNTGEVLKPTLLGNGQAINHKGELVGTPMYTGMVGANGQPIAGTGGGINIVNPTNSGDSGGSFFKDMMKYQLIGGAMGVVSNAANNGINYGFSQIPTGGNNSSSGETGQLPGTGGGGSDGTTGGNQSGGQESAPSGVPTQPTQPSYGTDGSYQGSTQSPSHMNPGGTNINFNFGNTTWSGLLNGLNGSSSNTQGSAGSSTPETNKQPLPTNSNANTGSSMTGTNSSGWLAW